MCDVFSLKKVNQSRLEIELRMRKTASFLMSFKTSFLSMRLSNDN